MLQTLSIWHKTKPGLLFFSVIEWLLAYVFGSLAIDRGNLWYYLLTLTFLVGALQNTFKLIGAMFHGRGKTGRTR